MDQPAVSRKREIIATLAVLIVIVVIVGTVIATAKPNKQVATTNTTATSGTTQPAANYKDGTYSATGTYDSPGGQEGITINVTLKNNVITDTSAISGSTGEESREYQKDFIGAYKQMVVGKNISSVKLSRVAGSSLTSLGFNSAIQQIESQAKA